MGINDKNCTDWNIPYASNNKKIGELELSIRVYNSLFDAHYHDTDSIIRSFKSISDMKKIRNLGDKGIKEIIDKMKRNGYTEWYNKIILTK